MKDFKPTFPISLSLCGGVVLNVAVIRCGICIQISERNLTRKNAASTSGIEVEPVMEALKAESQAWDSFKVGVYARREEHERHAIEVLVGEPDVRKKEHRPAERKGQTVTTKKFAGGSQLPGQAPVAERIRINSTHIIKVLEKIRGKSLTSEDGAVVIIRPFRVLAYYSDQIQQTFRELESRFATQSETGAIAENVSSEVTGTTILSSRAGTVQNEIADARDPAADEEGNKMAYLASDDCQKINFADLWYLFKSRDEVVSRARRQVFRVIKVTSPPHKAVSPWPNFTKAAKSEELPVTITCVFIDLDGKQLGLVTCDFHVKRFKGEKLVTALDLYPLRFIREDAHGKPENDWKLVFNSIMDSTQEATAEANSCSAACCVRENVHADSYVEARRKDDYIAGLIPQDKFTEPSISIFPRNLADIRTSENVVPDEDLLIMSYRVFGYVLRSRKWDIGTKDKNLEGGAVGEGEDGDDGGVSMKQSVLVLPDGHKKMVKSLVAQHFRDKESATANTDQADIVRGKGKDLIILLHGAPGVGKTTTAEGIAELFEKPLFQITCGDLGTTASEVEKALETHFALASRWGCILLLDEADVFLAARTPQDFIRNGLVAGVSAFNVTGVVDS
ncbi:hypothetical protein CSAL01_08094 [Colletotrichum salicis]|uniref:AAA+ ATPase domain-containing protein n=1 Tax=Colletotrichum salicis TaxID=1209931 RepID=A0A135T1L9_9PEZI|nr:hypothetical protein CSAL01_08094 [Colletotrichum salicis]